MRESGPPARRASPARSTLRPNRVNIKRYQCEFSANFPFSHRRQICTYLHVLIARAARTISRLKQKRDDARRTSML